MMGVVRGVGDGNGFKDDLAVGEYGGQEVVEFIGRGRDAREGGG